MSPPEDSGAGRPPDVVATGLAASHRLSGAAPDPLAIHAALRTLPDWLEEVRAYCADPAPEHARAADWLLDNDYQVVRAIRLVRKELPREFYARLPALETGPASGLPRAFAVAAAMLENVQPQITFRGIVEFVNAYQSVAALDHGELWALPSMLRLACLEQIADAFARLDPDLAPPFEISALSRAGDAAAATDRIARAIGVLATVQAIKWADILDRTSPIDMVLSGDPAGAYAAMSFDTRERYRKTVERVAYRSGLAEREVAQIALDLAREAAAAERADHVGRWLIDTGLPELEARAGYRPRIRETLGRLAMRNAWPLYAAVQGVGLLAALVPPALYLGATSASAGQWGAGIALSVLPASLVSVTVVHWLITKAIPPRTLPELDFSKLIPPEFATAVVVPAIVGRAGEVQAILDKIELRRLSNPDPALLFVLLSDPADAAAEHRPEDPAIEDALVAGIRRLNARYGGAEGGPFVLLHRGRRYNPGEGCWMAWERKRGKLEEFNRLVTDGKSDAFVLSEGPVDRLQGVRYAITLDADTELPPGAAARLVGTLAHPLNRARPDADTGGLAAGYAILQPRIELKQAPGTATLFSHIYAGDTAIDIYSRAVSDVYQDLFGTGIFVGKGIYDIAAVQRCLEGRVPENSILSHDLFEGVHARAALVSNIILYEDYPVSYLEYDMRAHRWQRGDWQLLPWLGRTVPVPGGRRLRNRLSALDRWKIADNLRRSLVAPGLLLLLVSGWTVLPGNPLVWTLLALAAPGSYLVGEVAAFAAGGVRRGILSEAWHRVVDSGGRWLASVIFLVSDALTSLDAALRTLWRLVVSRKDLLQWKSAAQTSSDLSRSGVRAVAWSVMWPSSALAFVLAAHLGLYNVSALLAASPVLLLWFAAPEIAVWTGRHRVFRRDRLTATQRAYLAAAARRTWYFFETFAGPEDNWLPPDNVQETPELRVAHRTSPTNIGMYLVSALAARDFGFVPNSELLVRCRNTLDSVGRMKTYRAHVLNWYDTRTLEPLEPQYVSTVDSGNLAVSLVALKQGCLEIAEGPALHATTLDGLGVTLDLTLSAARGLAAHDARALSAIEREIRRIIRAARSSPAAWRGAIDELWGTHWPALEAAIRDAVERSDDIGAEALAEIHVWPDRFRHHLAALRRDTDHYLPWLALTGAAPEGEAALARDVGRMMAPATAIGATLGNGARLAATIDARLAAGTTGDVARDWLMALRAAIEEGCSRQKVLRSDLEDLATRADAVAYGMDFRFLYNREARLFVIGYNLSVGQMDANHYDLLATEARLASFFAVAKQDAPVEHWFAFSRPITRLGGKPSILSWNGSMFEYLMPPLFLPSGRDSLLGESEVTAIEYQQAYAAERGVPWGISESAFAATDSEGNYQYRAFGVPGLGIRRGLTRDLVVAPYATALALCARPGAAVENLRALHGMGAVTCYGFLEALDFTPGRVAGTGAHLPVQAHMAHHQGMILAAIANALDGDILVRRVRREKPLMAIELLLNEQVPWDVPMDRGRADEAWERHADTHVPAALPPWEPSPESSSPQMHILGNGRLSAMVSDAGAGGLSWRGQALTRWRSDPTCDDHGIALYLRDTETGALWSAGRFPTGAPGLDARTIYHQHMVEMFRRDHGLAMRAELTVAPFSDVEIRRISLVNESDRPREIELTSYAEIALAPALDDERHPAFSKLFVRSDYLAADRTLLFERRPRRPEARPPVLAHGLVVEDGETEISGYETDRRRFLGRGGSLRAPRGLAAGLEASAGWTLDPVAALQTRLTLAPGQERRLAFLTAAAPTRERAMQAVRQFAADAGERAFREAALEAAREVGRSGADPSHLPELQVLSALLLQPNAVARNVGESGAGPWGGQPELWRFGISGDHPLLVFRTDDEGGTDILEVLVRARNLWHRRGLVTDLVVLREGLSGYDGPLRAKILSILRDSHSEGLLGRDGGVHLLSSDQMDAATRRGIEAAAHVQLDGDDVTLTEKLDRVLEARMPLPRFEPPVPATYRRDQPLPRPEGLLFDNGYGGFDPESGDYVIHLEPGATTPAPWCNVLANEDLGTIVSEAGLGFSWAVNSGEHRLTPWSNDPVADAGGEALYLRDEASAEVWTPTPAPMGGATACRIRHGAGFTQWTRNAWELEQDCTVLVPPDAPVKLVRMRLKNHSAQARRITATYYAEWLLGALPSVSKPHVECRYDPARRAILGRNRWNPEFGERVAFLTASADPHSVTGDRKDFLGRGGDMAAPDALGRWDLGGRFTPGGDACAAYQVHLDIAAQGTAEVVFALGEGADEAEAAGLIVRWQAAERFDDALAAVDESWARRLGAVRVKTPDPALDLMVNRWLPYQNLSCRVLARAGFYQAGGAFGFRDQLQDVLALMFSAPELARAQILRAARHQFEAGDALHWWHPPEGRGVKTRCSDDYLWLAYVTAAYVTATGDRAILDEEVPFLTAPDLRDDEEDRYARFETGETAPLVEHCARALDRAVTATGPHGLPLIGAGDWNDGMDRVGMGGRGESLWLAWFQLATIRAFAPLAEAAPLAHRAQRWADHAGRLRAAIEAHGWDGGWYLRAFDDDGVPWGSEGNDECRIDLIAQAWSVLSGEPVDERARTALEAAQARLVSEDDRLIRLLDPPFHDTPRDPGYIRAYPPGTRENGGQYTHAAAWLGHAWAGLGDGDRAWAVFDIINPIRRAASRDGADAYRREPYVLAGDVSVTEGRFGQGGWSWYTGAAGWTWQLAVSGILGARLEGGEIVLEPCLPRNWGGADLRIESPRGALEIRIEDPGHLGRGVVALSVNGAPVEGRSVPFPGTGKTARVVARLGKAPAAGSAAVKAGITGTG